MKSHFLCVTPALFGHARPLFALALNLILYYPDLYVTVLSTGTTSAAYVSPHEREIALFELPPQAHARLNIKFLGSGERANNLEQVASMTQEFPPFLKSLCANPLDAVDVFSRAPNLIIFDAIFSSLIKTVREVVPSSGNPATKIPIFFSWPSNASTKEMFFVPSEEYPDTYWKTLVHRARKEVADGLVTVDEIQHMYNLWTGPTDADRMIRMSGVAPIYHHELTPQSDSIPHGKDTIQYNYPMIAYTVGEDYVKADGFIIPFSDVLERGVSAMLEKVTGQAHLPVGGQYPPSWWEYGISSSAQVLSPQDKESLDFLDACLERYGPKSVIYISFGTLFAPVNRPELFETLVGTLLTEDPPLPFLFAGGYAQSFVSDKLRESVKKSEFGKMIPDFVPQQAVLNHLATGWFLSHSGSGSVMESILNAVPMVLWPFTMDQPIIATQIAVNQKVAFELLQVRNGASIGRKAYRDQEKTISGMLEDVAAEMHDVWKRLRGEEGQAMRQRMIELRQAVKDDRERGEAKRAMEQFRDYMVVH
ncbi:UDP-Glycosyltransferase/glycogen phosphorylase [Fistulina hepatica ATCC 64428]|uniref:UDP-Glycosyltransferase/glycogen phosphorylase n=1 Tax=Fistulina hepatica ATCC 64428 TaxID=1128425 RepID=A0A0D7ANB0_9AGAR|nr:UDP-Glycosyltransferase/glycogen phosphorylase [Fistulina hepatica ATCC 64428]